jgi:hypothetical protein
MEADREGHVDVGIPVLGDWRSDELRVGPPNQYGHQEGKGINL